MSACVRALGDLTITPRGLSPFTPQTTRPSPTTTTTSTALHDLRLSRLLGPRAAARQALGRPPPVSEGGTANASNRRRTTPYPPTHPITPVIDTTTNSYSEFLALDAKLRAAFPEQACKLLPLPPKTYPSLLSWLGASAAAGGGSDKRAPEVRAGAFGAGVNGGGD